MASKNRIRENKPSTQPAAQYSPKVATSQGEEKSKPISIQARRVRTVCMIVFIGLVCSLLFHNYQASLPEKDVYPYNTFLFKQTDRFNDFNNIYTASADLNPFSSSVSVYFPFTYIITYLFTKMDQSIALGLFLMSFVAFYVYYLYKNLPLSESFQKIIAIVILSAMSYPFLFLVDRANLEAWGFISIASFLYFYVKKQDFPAVICLAIATSFKLYPALFAVLFLIDRKYLMALYTGLIAGVLALGSAAILKGGIAGSIAGQKKCLEIFNQVYLNGSSHGMQHSSSFFVPLKLFYYNILATSGNYPANYENFFNNNYFLVAIVLFLPILFVLLRYQLPLWKKVALMVSTFILLPQISYDYKLISLMIPVVLYFQAEEQGKFDKYYAILFGLLLIPKDYYIITIDLSISSILTPIILLVLMILLVVETVKESPKLNWSNNGA